MQPGQPTKTIATTLEVPAYLAFGVKAAQRGISRAELARQLLIKEISESDAAKKKQATRRQAHRGDAGQETPDQPMT
jgi:hypothetical protein